MPHLFDFSGGIDTETPDILTQLNSLRDGKNVIWTNGLTSRPGFETIKNHPEGIQVLGIHKTYLSGTALYVLVIKTDDDIEFHLLTSLNEDLTAPIHSFPGSASYVSIAEIDRYIVVVSKDFDPMVIEYDFGPGTFTGHTLESYDVRERDSLDTNIGRAWIDEGKIKFTSFTKKSFYQSIDPTIAVWLEIQKKHAGEVWRDSTGGAGAIFKYEYAPTVGGKMEHQWVQRESLTSFNYDQATDPEINWRNTELYPAFDQRLWENIDDEKTYIYSEIGSVWDWTEHTPELSITDFLYVTCNFFFDTIELTGIPEDTIVTASYVVNEDEMVVVPVIRATDIYTLSVNQSTLRNINSYDGNLSQLRGSIIVRLDFSTVVTIPSNFKLSHVKYLSTVLGYQRPSLVAVYNSTPMLITGNTITFGGFNRITEWSANDIEFFPEGGSTITSVAVVQGNLVVIKPRGLYSMAGQGYKNFVKRFVTNIGSDFRSAIVVNDQEVYFGNKHGIFGYNGGYTVELTKHVKKYFKGVVNVIGTRYNEHVYFFIQYEDNSRRVILFDPDTFARSPNGDGRVSIFSYEGIPAIRLFNEQEWEPAGSLYGFVDRTMYHLFTGDTDDGIPIKMVVETPFYALEDPVGKKQINRFRPLLSPAGPYLLEFIPEEDESRTVSKVLETGIGSRLYDHYETLPYTLDGRTLKVRITHEGSNGVVQGMTLEAVRRVK